ncbi:tetratricopeptide repeat protein [Stakelama saccharophila]|uniref:Tetratricopeptide repeat protein n=1 Tax=Stakelama saccharophila TaxID=3075605 RepID=A0ABZ0B6D1_9SPHN|nr:tetratricopeptide repeat protein [Stakelama sp. W311]WNO52955.1 tetratricopeptide repeat protein [Stakelama sp. W311]
MKAFLMLAAVGSAAAATPAMSRDHGRYADAEILNGNYLQAERLLTARMRASPDQPEILLNLAAVYARTNREAAARALYERVLEQEAVLLTLPADRVASSHVVARAGLSRLPVAAVNLSAR